jgi:16S rRNA (guanine966-N2)-methyltransferase
VKNQIRIIAGKWRSRKLDFPELPELRPTPDRVRETLFNWLSPYIVGARCLDLFAGSGALSFEALSRGAISAVMIDQASLVIQQLSDNVRRLDVATSVQLYCSKMPTDQLLLQQQTFDIVFLDPPFHQGYLPVCCEWLEKMQCLAKGALIYIEVESTISLPLPIPATWKILREQKAGQVKYFLVQA